MTDQNRYLEKIAGLFGSAARAGESLLGKSESLIGRAGKATTVKPKVPTDMRIGTSVPGTAKRNLGGLRTAGIFGAGAVAGAAVSGGQKKVSDGQEKLASLLGGVAGKVGNFAKNVSGENLRTAKRAANMETSMHKAYDTAAATHKDVMGRKDMAMNAKNHFHKARMSHLEGMGDAETAMKRGFGATKSVADAAKDTRNARLGAGAAVGGGAGVAALLRAKKKD